MTKKKLIKPQAISMKSLSGYLPVILFVLVTAIIGTKLLLVSHAATNANGKFYIVGSDIVDPGGNKFYPIGANVGINGQIGFNYNDSAINHAADAAAWGWNTVRLNIYCTTSTPWINTYGYANMLRDTKAFIDAYTAKNIVVMIECHDGNPDDSTVRAGYDKFWTDIMTSYKTNTYVWANPLNEPYWNQNSSWEPQYQHYYDLIRGLGGENIIVADALNAGNDSGWDGASRLYDANIGPALVNGRCNVLLSLHAYGGMGGDSAHSSFIDAVHAKGLAMIVGEFGYTTEGSSTAGNYAMNVTGTTAVYDVAPGKGVGMLWWNGTHNDKYSLKADNGPFWEQGNSGNLSIPGQKFWNLSHNRPNLGAFTGNYATSNCPSAVNGGQGGTPPVSTPPPTPTPTPTPVATPQIFSPGQYNDTDFTYTGNWQVSSGTPKYQGDDHYSNTANDSAVLNFKGTQVKLYGGEASQYGKVAVSIDGGAETTVDLYAATRSDQVAFYTSPTLTNGTHTVKIRVTGTKNASATDSVVSLDKIDVIEAAAPVLTGDINSDGHINTLDLSILIAHDGQNYAPADLNHDGTVGAADLAVLLARWTW
jgi:mannan endo-1,4-beta-mannosidase